LAQLGEDALSLGEILRVILAFAAGTSTGGNTGTITFYGYDGATARIVATTSTDGDRSVVVLDGTD
jgi:hypothetical protein